MNDNKPAFPRNYITDGHNGMTTPAKLQEKHLLFLDKLRESGATNMYGARPYVEREFEDLTGAEAGEILAYWMKTFSERHPKANRVEA